MVIKCLLQLQKLYSHSRYQMGEIQTLQESKVSPGSYLQPLLRFHWSVIHDELYMQGRLRKEVFGHWHPLEWEA